MWMTQIQTWALNSIQNTNALLLSLPNPSTYGWATGQGGDLLTHSYPVLQWKQKGWCSTKQSNLYLNLNYD